MGNVRYTKSDYKGARSVGGTPRFCGSPGRSHRGTTQHRVSLQGGGIRPDHERPAMLPRSRGGDGRGRNGNRQREKTPATPTDQPGLGREEAKKSPVCDLIAEGRGRGKFARRPDHRGDSEAPGEWHPWGGRICR